MRGLEWIIDARGCNPETLRDAGALQALFDRIVHELALHAGRAGRVASVSRARRHHRLRHAGRIASGLSLLS